MKDMDNLFAWAVKQGYDPGVDYAGVVDGDPPGDGSEPLLPGKPPPLPLPNDYISEHFRQAEFACNHCGKLHPTNPTPPQQVLDWLEDIRAHFGGKPVVVNSGYRCPVHNANVGGAKNSFHLKGQAADFRVQGIDPAEAYAYADKLIGAKGGVGKYPNFTHIDNRGYKARW